MYKNVIKRIIDIILSFIGLVVLSPLFLILIIAVKLDDPGPAFFAQKRVGKGKEYFQLHKFRSMKMSTPHDVPTHMLSNPEQYITKVGKFLRKTSLDELPQIWDIFAGHMSVIGPRPALWNQYDLIEERDKYGANDIKPGLTGWAQINGRDELEIPIKAAFDGEYVEKMSFLFDVKCFIGTVFNVIKQDGVVEGGTGEMSKASKTVMVISCHTHSLFWFRTEMMKDFKALGYNVVAAGQLPESEWAEKFAEFGIKYRQIDAERNGTNPLNDLKTLRSILKLLKQEKPDKIFTYQAKTVIYGGIAARLKGIKEVYPLIAGLGSVLIGEDSLVKKLMLIEYKIAFKLAKKVMFQNPDDLMFFAENKIVDANKCHIINGSGVDTNKFAPLPMPTETAFLCISRLIRDKGVGEYIDAAREIHKKYPETRCLLVGPFDTNPSAVTEEELQKYIDDGSIEYFGEQTDIRPYMEMCNVYVLPSYREGTPKSVLEAMACERAVITTDAPGCRETVTDKVNGVLIPVRDVQSLVRAMEDFILSPSDAERMGREGRKIAVEKYDVRKVNASIIEIMELENKKGAEVNV